MIGNRITLRWRVEPGPINRSPVNRISIISPSLGINLSSADTSGVSSVVIPSRVEPGRYQIILTATDQAGRQTNRSVDVQVIADEPIIREFSIDPTIIAADHEIRFRWRVESPPGGSRIRIVRITPDITADLPFSGDRPLRIDVNAPSQIKRYILTATNEAGRSVSRNVDVEIKSREEMRAAISIDRLSTEPRNFSLEQEFVFTITFNNPTRVRYIETLLTITGEQRSGGGLPLRWLSNLIINPGVNTYTARFYPGRISFDGRLDFLKVYLRHLGKESREFSVRQVGQVVIYTVE